MQNLSDDGEMDAMMALRDDFSPIRFSTNEFAPKQREEAFREIYGRALIKLEFEPFAGQPFEMDMQLRVTRDFGMSFGGCSPVTFRRTASLIDGDDLILVSTLNGGGCLQTLSNEARINAGEAVLTDMSKAGRFDVFAPSTLLNLRFSLARIVPMLADVDAALMHPIPRHSEALRLLLSYADTLKSDLILASPDLRDTLITHLHDLAALALGATADSAHIAYGRGAGAARLHAIKTDIKGRADLQYLTIAQVADRHGVTTRYINILFEKESETFSEFLLRQRLLRAHRMLQDPRYSNQTISAIAYQVGFGDISYFNRCFRRRYGITPSDVRAAKR